MDLINVIVLSKLEGSSGSNPQIVAIFPKQAMIDTNVLLEQTLPHGCAPDGVFVSTFNKEKQPILGICFEEPMDQGRSTIASIVFFLTKNVRIDDFAKMVMNLVHFLQQANCLSINFLQSQLNALFESINEFKPFKLHDSCFDFQKKVQDMNLNPIHLPRKRKGII